MSIKDKVIIITGASSGIGEATAKLLAQRGGEVVIAARRLDRLTALKDKLPQAEILPVKADVTKPAEMQKLVDQALQAYGHVDVLFNNAGLMNVGLLSTGDVDQWNAELDTNIKGVLNGIHAVLPVMKKQRSGHIITTDSIAGLKTWAGYAIYSGSKYAVRAIMESLRQEVAADYIKTTTLCPGIVATGLHPGVGTEKIDPASAKLLSHPEESPMDILQPEEIA